MNEVFGEKCVDGVEGGDIMVGNIIIYKFVMK